MIFIALLLGSAILLTALILVYRKNFGTKTTNVIKSVSSAHSGPVPIQVLSLKSFSELDDISLHHTILNHIKAKLNTSDEFLKMETIQRVETMERIYLVADIFDVHVEKEGLIVLCDKFGIPLCSELQVAMECFDAREHLRILNELIPFVKSSYELQSALSENDKAKLHVVSEQFRTLKPLRNYAVSFARKNAELFCPHDN